MSERYWCDYCGSYSELDKQGRCLACGAPYRKKNPKRAAWEMKDEMISSDSGEGRLYYTGVLCSTNSLGFGYSTGA